MKKLHIPSRSAAVFIAVLVASISCLFAKPATATPSFIDVCGTVTVNGVPTTNVLVSAWTCDTNDTLIAWTVSTNGLPDPYNYHLVYVDGIGTPPYFPLYYYLVFSYENCDPVVVSCEEIAALIDSSDGKITVDADIQCYARDGEARTPGYWQSKHGKRLIEQNNLLPMLNECCLVDQDGNDEDFANFRQFRTWLKEGNAENMAFQLSRHLAAMKLNVAVGYVGEGDLIYDPECGEIFDGPYVSIGDVMEAANDALCEDGLTEAGDENRDYQECLKDALDAANNNMNWVEEL